MEGGWRGTRVEIWRLASLGRKSLGFPNLASRLAEARRRLVHVTSSRRSHGVQVEDGQVDAMGYVGLCYPYINVFYVLGLRDIVVI
jgi:hypothetical protein